MPATVWKGYLTFGLVSFPIRLYAAARPEPVHFHLLHKKDLSRVKEVMYCAREDKPLDRSEIVKGYEYEKDEYVVIEPEELEKIAPPTATVMEILQFVRMSEIDPIFFETSYYVAPEEAVSRPDELHEEKKAEVPSPGKVAKKEVDLAKKLIETLAAPFKPERFHDEYKENVEKLIESKRKGRKVVPIRQPKTSPVTDLMTALQQSLAKTGAKSAATKTHASTKKSAKTQRASVA